MRPVFKVPAMRFPVTADLMLPGSKSQANRAIVCAILASGSTVIHNATPCDDVSVMVENVQKLGFDVKWIDQAKGELHITGGLPHSGSSTQPIELDCHNAGTTLRFLTSLACIVPGVWKLTGDKHMLRRPIHDLLVALRSLGAEIEDTNGALPITVRGGTLRGGKVSLKADISSQYLTSLLLVAPVLKDGLSIDLTGPLASSGYVELTRRVMHDFGSNVTSEHRGFAVQPTGYKAFPSYEVEGDWSAAGVWLVLEALTGSTFRFANVSRTSEQSDRHVPGLIATLRTEGDLEIDCSETPDQLMNLAVLAAFRRGKTYFIGTRNLRHKECDRLHVLTVELSKAGVDITEHEDGVTVRGPLKIRSTSHAKPKTFHSIALDPSNDHRMAMCFTIIGLLRGGISVRQADCVGKSYPNFYDHLHAALSVSKPIAIVGMRGAGKSSLGRRLAKALQLRHVDSDHVFIDRHGPIREYVSKHGWRAFREEEAKVIADCIRPGVVLSCGGGSIESVSVRQLLIAETMCVWLHARKSVLMDRLQSGKRPPLTNLPLSEEVDTLLEKRIPYYKEVSLMSVPASIPFSGQASYVARKLRDYVKSFDLHSRKFLGF